MLEKIGQKLIKMCPLNYLNFTKIPISLVKVIVWRKKLTARRTTSIVIVF
jgi:hypothetical protein